MAEIPVITNNPAIAPAILTQPATISKAKGETAKFHCLVQHLGKSSLTPVNPLIRPDENISDGRHIVWRRGFNVLATGHTVIVADSRVSIEKHKGVNSLVIKDISEQDAGDYVCQVREGQDCEDDENSNNILFRSRYRMIFSRWSTDWTY